jgi:hypothetical protein
MSCLFIFLIEYWSSPIWDESSFQSSLDKQSLQISNNGKLLVCLEGSWKYCKTKQILKKGVFILEVDVKGEPYNRGMMGIGYNS